MNIFRVEKNIEKMKDILNKTFAVKIKIDGGFKDEFMNFIQSKELYFIFSEYEINFFTNYDFIKYIWVYTRTQDSMLVVEFSLDNQNANPKFKIDLEKLFIKNRLDEIEKVYQFIKELPVWLKEQEEKAEQLFRNELERNATKYEFIKDYILNTLEGGK